MSELAWASYRCECGGTAVMGVMSLVAHCDRCPRVYVHGRYARGWFANVEEANEREDARGHVKRQPTP